MLSIKDYRTSRSALRVTAKKIDAEYLETEEFRQKLEQMKTLLNEDGIGLAATQVGWPVQLFLLAIDENENELEEPAIIINPEILEYSKKTDKMEEGCLSFPDLFIKITRPKSIKWKHQTPEGLASGEEVHKSSDGFYARAIQHEIDHLNGMVFVDRATPVQKLKFNKWLKS